MKAYCKLTKVGIVIFALLTASVGYLLSLDKLSFFDIETFVVFLIGFYLICSGSFILNQAQEWKIDQKMKRTQSRPIPQKKISPLQAYILSFWFLFIGTVLLLFLQPLTAGLSLLTVILYNFFYTLWWKKTWSYGAILGALPGALPPVIGYSLGGGSLWTGESLYLFLIMFLWQMPHFLSLALRYKEDYKAGGIPVLPVVSSSKATIYQIGLYMIAYLGLALISPLFLRSGVMYVFLFLPLAFKLIYEFYKYSKNTTNWLSFFLWINLSLLVYVAAPVFDKWLFDYLMYQ